MKKMYVKPTMDVVEYGMTQVIWSSNQVKSINSSELQYGGGNSGPARANNRGGIWDED